jgi:hypothetical protein
LCKNLSASLFGKNSVNVRPINFYLHFHGTIKHKTVVSLIGTFAPFLNTVKKNFSNALFQNFNGSMEKPF